MRGRGSHNGGDLVLTVIGHKRKNRNKVQVMGGSGRAMSKVTNEKDGVRNRGRRFTFYGVYEEFP